MNLKNLRTSGVCLLFLSVGTGLRAGEWELGASLAVAQEEKGQINSLGNWPTTPYTTVKNNFDGLWYQGGIHVGYEVLRRGVWGYWAQAQYSEGLSHPGLFHKGENISVGTTVSETYRGNATYHSHTLGFAITRTFALGELGLGIGRRSHSLSVDGPLETRTNSTFTYSQFAVSHGYQDNLVVLSFTALQNQGKFRTFQKFSMASGFGSTVPTVNPGPGDWQMREAYLAQIRPSREFRVTLGVRL